MELLLKACIGAAIAVIFTLLGRAEKGHLAGLIALFPVFTALGYWLVSASSDTETLRAMVKAGLYSSPVLIGFYAGVWLAIPHMSWRLAIGIGLLVWLGLAAIWVRWVL